MYDLTRFTLRDMVECGMALRQIGLDADSMEQTSNRIIRYLYENFCTKPTGEKSCTLIRLFKTHPYQDLEPELAESARSMLGNYPCLPALKCMTLLATAGEQTEWNSRHTSAGHKAIPLASESVVAQMPMISQLIRQLGLDIKMVLDPDPNLLLEIEQRKYNVFYVPEAIDSPHIPARNSFVIPFGIKSVLGFGGLLPSGNLFAIIMFLKVTIPHSTAQMFSTLALNVKAALLPFDGGTVFVQKKESAKASKQISTRETDRDKVQLKSQVATLTQLLEVFEQSILVQSDRLEQLIEQLAESAQKSQELLLNILPEQIVKQLKQNPAAIAEQFNEVTILFADLVGFTPLAARLKPIEIVNLLNEIFSSFDAQAEHLGLEKIKTIGDAYMVAAGLPIPRADHAEAIADMALAMQAALDRVCTKLGEDIQIRIGINTGIVIAGVIGTRKFIYDLWGDAVNIASRMESSSEPGSIQVTKATYERLKDKYVLQKRGIIKVKGKGEMVTYWLVGSQTDTSFGA
ncbi:adenylate/guanylate cyclase domain-containing protein [Argonema antarcticum]|uniref:adenylate/guanylate cyclase domain-containing protein n=1 Tax=Argonema antarcticum TaxID=2942763 RepID=UPI0020136CCC|nr:adenylate/guanylate cyclase domain-containing protein [Argonema antarcticum]MCL1470358.1 adenylate/guanylate cyclase domain-containing protein [Argonema antarcticum A004/B2]